MVHKLHLATIENTTSSECRRSRAEGQQDFLVVRQSVSLRWPQRSDGNVTDPLRLITNSSTQSSNLWQHPLLLLFQLLCLHKILYLDLSLNFLPLCCTLPLCLSLPVHSHGLRVSRRMVLRSEIAMCSEKVAKLESSLASLEH